MFFTSTLAHLGRSNLYFRKTHVDPQSRYSHIYLN